MAVGIGPGWVSLGQQLAEQLVELEPPAQLLGIDIDADGLPRFRVRVDAPTRAEGRRLVERYESRALDLCELCGHAGHVYAGAVITARCDHCV